MKNVLILIFLIAFGTSSYGQFWKSKPKSEPKPSSTPVKVVTERKTTLQEAREIIKELNSELEQAKNANEKLKSNLISAEAKVKDAELNTQQVQKNADALKTWGIDQQNKAFEWMDKHTKTLKKYHRLKNISALVAALFGAMLGMYCMRLVPPIYAAYALALPIAGAILAFSGVWLLL
jgi:TolA-binding protein